LYIASKTREIEMPTISMFFGILIKMFFVDTEKHHVPHIHAEYQGDSAVYSIPDGELLAGSLPSQKQKLVIAWIEIHKDDLLADWDLAVNGKTPFPIRGLDQ
jgi:desulfoferrodoxin (superoxide reductase-like protein)